jgi:pheromone a factor receptor
MWSIGVIATALLTGDVIFTNRIDPNYSTDPAKVILDIAAECDLSVLDNPYSAWAIVGDRPKDFIRKLLVLDEEQRLTVNQALAHEWFTNKHLADQFDAVYQRAIKGWESRRKIFRLVEALDLSRLPPQDSSPRPRKNKEQSSTSHYFVRPPIPDLPSGNVTNSNAFSKRAYTPLPKITEESELDELDELSMQYSEVQSTETEGVFDVQNSLSQLAISAHSFASEVGTNILMTDNGASNEDPLEDQPNLFANIDFSSSPAGQPPSPSPADLSDADVVPDTPQPDRKRKSSPTSEGLDIISVLESSFDDTVRVDLNRMAAKKMRVA